MCLKVYNCHFKVTNHKMINCYTLIRIAAFVSVPASMYFLTELQHFLEIILHILNSFFKRMVLNKGSPVNMFIQKKRY